MTEIAGGTKPSSARSILRGLFDRRASATRSLKGSTAAARELGRLGPGWSVVDDIPTPLRGRLDYLVIGPGGVFAVTGQHEARHTICLGGDILLVDGQRVHHARQGREDVAEVSARLTEAVGFPVPVTALVFVVGDRRFVVPPQPDDAVVRVTTPAAAVRWMRRHSVEWTDYGVARIHAAAEEFETWEPRAARQIEPDTAQRERGDSRAAS